MHRIGHHNGGPIWSTTIMSKPTRIEAGHYEYKGFNIERREDGEWYTGPIGEWAQDVTDTLAEAVAIVDLVTEAEEEDTMTYAEYQQQQQTEADEWLATYGDDLDPIIEPGSDTGPRRSSPRPASDKALHTMVLSGVEVVRERQQLSATEAVALSSELPSDSLAGVDPEELGFYAVSHKQAQLASRARATHGIEFTLNVKGQVRGGKSGKTRETKAEKAARLAARFNR